MLYKGDRVALISDIYGDKRNNPVWGGRQGHVLGTVESSENGYTIVYWDNGTHNGYARNKLSRKTAIMFEGSDSRLNPNNAFLRRKSRG